MSLKGFKEEEREQEQGMERERKFDMTRFRFQENRSGACMKNILVMSKSRGKKTLQETSTVFSNFSVYQNHLEVLL